MTIEVRRLSVADAAAFEHVADGLYEARGAQAEPAVMHVYRL